MYSTKIKCKAKRWDDSPFDMELAQEEELKTRTAFETVKGKFRHIRQDLFKKVCRWFT